MTKFILIGQSFVNKRHIISLEINEDIKSKEFILTCILTFHNKIELIFENKEEAIQTRNQIIGLKNNSKQKHKK